MSGVRLTRIALRPKPFVDCPKTLGEHLKKCRLKRSLLQREAAELLGIGSFTYLKWEKGTVAPEVRLYPAIIAFLGYEPPMGDSLRERVEGKRQLLGVTLSQVAQHLGWDEGTLRRYLNRAVAIPEKREQALNAFLETDAAMLESIRSLPRRKGSRERP